MKNNTKKILVITSSFFTLMLSSCISSNIGGGCEYKNIEGTATITSIEKSTVIDSSCPNRQIVKFKFVPNNSVDLTSSDNEEKTLGQNLSTEWIKNKEIVVGKKYNNVTKKTETKGTCSPEVFIFPDLPDAGISTCK